MQDIHSIGSCGGVGRLFVGGDRRLRPHHGQIPPAMKCPRCESNNTKFCYYNNYNLSQPRHYCKSCRRYWTKGGVLRNVPVGGGCRKTKRSKPKANNASDDVSPKEQKSSISHSQNSSSESSSLTATTTVAAVTATTATVVVAETAKNSKQSSSDNSASTLLNFHDSRFSIIHESTTANPSFDPPVMDQSPENGMFPEIGSFTGMMTSSNNVALPLNFNTVPMLIGSSSDQWQGQQGEVRMEELGGGYMDHTAEMELSELQNRRNDCGLAAVDWESGGDEGLFDLTGTVDQSYWNQTQWPDHDHHLNYLP